MPRVLLDIGGGWDVSFRTFCPVCKGPIAGWVVRRRFQCPNCQRMLWSNRSSAMAWTVVVGGAFFLPLYLLSRFYPWDPHIALGINLAAFVFSSVAAYLVFRKRLRIRMTRQR